MKKLVCLLLVWSVLILLVFLGCASPRVSTTNNTIASITLTDQLGRTVTIDKVPQRIISLAPSNTEILYALDLLIKWWQ